MATGHLSPQRVYEELSVDCRIWRAALLLGQNTNTVVGAKKQRQNTNTVDKTADKDQQYCMQNRNQQTVPLLTIWF